MLAQSSPSPRSRSSRRRSAADEKPELVIYTYDSFTSEWGPGPAIAKAFEATCGCTVRFVGAGDGAALLSRLKLEGKRVARPTSCSGSTPT